MDPEALAKLQARFWRHVRRTRRGHWRWTAGLADEPRAYLGEVGGKRLCRAPARVAFELLHGPVPAGHRVVRTCSAARCVRPSHLKCIARPVPQAPRGRGRKLDPQAVEMIRERAADGVTQRALAAEFGVSDSIVSRIVNHLAWNQEDRP